MANDSSSSTSNSGPRLDVQYSAPGFCLPHPKTVHECCQNRSNLIFCHGCTIVKISPEIVVKFGPDINIIEAKNMVYVAQHTTVPVPKVFAYYTYGPIDRDVDDYGSLYDTYIFMGFADGQTLDMAWDTFDASTKAHVSRQLEGYIRDLRSMEHSGRRYIGSTDYGPVTDHSLSTSLDKGK